MNFASRLIQKATIMSIKSVKFVISRFGVTSLRHPQRKVMYLPSVDITYQEKGRKRLSKAIGELVEEKSLYKLELVGDAFFVVRVGGEEYQLYDEDGVLRKAFKVEEVGEPVLFGEDYCVFTKNNIFTYFDAEGDVIAKREMTDEEWNAQFD